LPPNVIRRKHFNRQEFVGLVLLKDVDQNQPLTFDMISSIDSGLTYASLLQPGMRAISTPLSSLEANSRLISPGNRVDLVLTKSVADTSSYATNSPTPEDVKRSIFGLRNSNGQIMSHTFLSNILVIGLAQPVMPSTAIFQRQQMMQVSPNSLVQNPRAPTAAVLEVTPKQVEMIEIAEQLGDVSLSLHSLQANQQLVWQGYTDEKDVFSFSAKNPSVTIIRGTTSQEVPSPK